MINNLEKIIDKIEKEIDNYLYDIKNVEDKEKLINNLDDLYNYFSSFEGKYLSNIENKDLAKQYFQNIKDKKIKELAKILKNKKQLIEEYKELKEIINNLEKSSEQELFNLLKKASDIKFKEQAEILFYGILKSENNNIDKDENILIEIITKFNNQKNKRYELLAKLLLIIKYDEKNFYNIYNKYIKQYINETNKTKKKTIINNFFIEINEKYVSDFYKNKEGKAGTIDILLEINNKLYGIDVTANDTGEVDNKEGDSKLYQTIRHYIELQEISYKTGKEVAGYYFLANFNVSTKIKQEKDKKKISFYTINNLQRHLHKAFVVDSGRNIQRYKLLYWIHKNNFKTFDEIIEYIKNNAKNEQWTNILEEKLNKIDIKEALIYLLKNINPNIMYPEALRKLVGSQKNLEDNYMKESPIDFPIEMIDTLLADASTLEIFFRSYKSYINILEELSLSDKIELTEQEEIEISILANNILNYFTNRIKLLLDKIKQYSENYYDNYKNNNILKEIINEFLKINKNEPINKIIAKISNISEYIYSKYQKVRSNNLTNTLNNILKILKNIEKNQQIQEKNQEIIEEKEQRINEKQERIKEKQEMIELYEFKLNKLDKNNIEYQKIMDKITKNQQEIKQLEQEIQELQQEINKLTKNSNINNKEQELNSEKISEQEIKEEIIKLRKQIEENNYKMLNDINVLNNPMEKIFLQQQNNELEKQIKKLEQKLQEINSDKNNNKKQKTKNNKKTLSKNNIYRNRNNNIRI